MVDMKSNITELETVNTSCKSKFGVESFMSMLKDCVLLIMKNKICED